MKLKLYTDGGSRGNPGKSGIGVYITDENGLEIEKRYKYLGIKTNNEAEYLGAYFGIKRCIELGSNEIELYMDSDLVIKQLSGERKIKKDELKILNSDIKNLISEFNIKIHFNWIRREKNKEADRLSNVAMDSINK
ncbi:MAG: ribonuclease HI family protein [Candidatus Gracilibacteria bacterium]|nr:ribonuclease HI family protein [Candidatus Gracilibacteria bacterium]